MRPLGLVIGLGALIMVASVLLALQSEGGRGRQIGLGVLGMAMVALLIHAAHHLSFNFLQAWGWGPICFTEPDLMRVVEHAVFVIAESAVLLSLAHGASFDFRTSEELTDIANALVREDGSVDLGVASGRRVTAPASIALAAALGHIAQLIDHVEAASHVIRNASFEIASDNAQPANGLAVVASEVRNLAQRSASAAFHRAPRASAQMAY